jgi:heme/copper-type cytochrome/quinol oxidase subunit 2
MSQLQKAYSLLNFFNFETSFVFPVPVESSFKIRNLNISGTNLWLLLLGNKTSLYMLPPLFFNYLKCYSSTSKVTPTYVNEWSYTPSCFLAKYNDIKPSSYIPNNFYFLSTASILFSAPILSYDVLFYGNLTLNIIKNIFFTPKLPFNNKAYAVTKTNVTSKSGFEFLRSDVGSVRRLRVTKGICLPSDYPIHIICGSKDVIHSWAIPGLGIKIDCIPGYNCHRRVLFRWRGVYWGQCMEVCGRYHHWMPIMVKIVHRDLFLSWCLVYMRYINHRNIKDTQTRNKILTILDSKA